MKNSNRYTAATIALLWTVAVSVQAQVLSSPLGVSSQSGSNPAAPVVPHGQGAGVHSPLSPFAPLAQRTDVVPWSQLTSVTTRVEDRRMVPVYPKAVTALHQKTIRVQGFMMPLQVGEQQRHFLLSSVPLTCSFCIPGGPESMVEVHTKAPVKYSLGAVVVEGKFHVLQNDPYGLYYRITDGVGVK
ncbi:MAG: DUF3299 domain-containing protein [Hydrogenophaga sp.]|uniref:DUF3299 domain-containing protein n=1 Tax=Hydrogenophaga sp. TaxID=1904254 RepID=UPI002771D054|nr:DUF3299 domain-containing protein [Hydrogenophaga sp.]MDP2416435.1 DUF3299 domain-containing protein [Hydrogenophaga sp.]MDZ4187319.1 DUF3299 domain-containing protein [Hydrogenophaga sp.]